MRELGGGLSNLSFLVEAGDHYVVRLDGPSDELHQLHRPTEWRVLNLAADIGIAPQPRYFNPEIGALVTDFLEAATVADFDSEGIAQLFQYIHSLPCVHTRLDLDKRLQRYLQAVRRQQVQLPREMVQYEPRLADVLAELESLQTGYVLCHNDLLRANRIFCRDRWMALDWEYSAMGNPWFDLAAVCWEEELSEHEREAFAERYLCRAPEQGELRQLAGMLAIYGFLECAWHLAVTSTVQASKLDALVQAFQRIDTAQTRG